MNPYLRAADRLRQVAEQKLQARQADEAAKRARNAEGRFIPDDPATPDVNEAWVEVTAQTDLSQ
jgi:hypothetical protein